MRNSALLIVDMQPAVTTGMWQVDPLADRLAHVVQRARHHDAPVIFVHQIGPAPDLAEWELLPHLGARDGDQHIYKTATDSFYGTDLERTLSLLSVTSLVIGGVATELLHRRHRSCCGQPLTGRRSSR